MTETNESGAVPVLSVLYNDAADLDVVEEDGEYRVANHDELIREGKATDIIRGVDPETFEEFMRESDRIEPDSSLFSERVASLEIGEKIEVSND